MTETILSSAVEPAVQLAHRWAAATSHGTTSSESRTSRRLAALVSDPEGLDLAVRFVDRVARPEDLAVAARELGRLSTSAAGSFLSPVDRAMLGVGAAVARLAPSVVVPLARARLRQLVGHLVVDASDPGLAQHLANARADGRRLNVNLLGEAVLGEQEAAARTARTRQLLERSDVDYVSIKVSALVSQISPWDTEGTVARVLGRLRPLYRTAAAKTPAAFVNLDMEEYRDLDLTVAVFEAICDEAEFRSLQMGVVLQAYLPDSYDALQRLIRFAQARRAAGGAPIKIRLVKGANLAMEHVEAEAHGWSVAPYGSKEEVDANYVRMLDEILRPEVADAVRVGVASHNLFDLALAHHLAVGRDVAHAFDVEMLQGMAPAQARAVAAEVGTHSPLILYTPVVAAQDFDVAVSYLVRRLEENAAPENFVHAIFAPHAGDETGAPAPMADQEERFRASVAAVGQVSTERRRTAERAPTGPVFVNSVDSDPSLPEVRQSAQEWVAAPMRELTSPVLTSTEAVDEAVDRARNAQAGWAARPAAERAAVLRTVSDELEARRGELVTVAAHEGGKTVAESDPEVSEAIDFARYYADMAEQIEQIEEAEGLVFSPDGVVLVTPPWNFPIAIPAGGMLASLAAGSAVIAKPAPPVPGCSEVVVDAIHAAFAAHDVPQDLLSIVRTDEEDVGRHLVSHTDVDRVILTGAYETSRLFTSWRADRPLGPGVLAETSGKNALVVTPSADFDLAVADVLRSAFGHAGQKCSAASLLILVGSVATSERFRRQLVDAVSSLRVGWPHDLGTTMGPVIEPPQGKLRRALTTLEPGETWMVQPRQMDGEGRLWSPGVKEGVWPGSAFHLTEYFGPVLGIMTAETLQEAIEWQNATAYGLTGGLHSLDESEIRHWIAHVEVGNAYVNRHTTGAIVQRQSFGGWKRSSVGPGAKAGGPNYVAQLGTWATVRRPMGQGIVGARAQRLLETFLRLTDDPAEQEWLRVAAASDAWARDQIYRRESDPTGLRSEANVFRYRPVPLVTVRAGAQAMPVEVGRMVLAASCAGVPVEVSLHPAVAQQVSAALGPDQAVLDWFAESDEDFCARVARGSVTGRVRVIGVVPGLWDAAGDERADVTPLMGEVLASGRREMLTVLREQAISRTMHRFGHMPAREESPTGTAVGVDGR
ncbi:bifunctional proline dehydrogenase/L-glutamate gamma-semialdehyde dehydrogenase [Ruania halotolerans]|uniref:bifunctional proline dehydrogenase/L-glutamate gamma-semialdehyde dehydrogenase n=1 Tax=Ruania halotolerans TaxID=2897773 RepID=UPI001E42B722|nr:bifunctional proline dehydrogenase/L-glutamate gamma-semialdehyde dehydrogenase [Ruania halotolerans]UFU05542.1 bifunctional proline dehydrogenase/L-glutamate gamma-semialdehyde dehydrogenase [Ruania halotolerans]